MLHSVENPLAGPNRIGKKSFLSGESQVNLKWISSEWVEWMFGAALGREERLLALSEDHDTSVTKQSDATKWLLLLMLLYNMENVCFQRLCSLCNSVCSGSRNISVRTKATLSWKPLWIWGHLALCSSSYIFSSASWKYCSWMYVDTSTCIGF